MTNTWVEKTGEQLLKLQEQRLAAITNVVQAARDGLLVGGELHAELDQIEVRYTASAERVMQDFDSEGFNYPPE